MFKIHNFTSVVGSYSCVSNENATGELMISIRINGTWSKYFTYGAYGLGRNNLYYDDSDAIAEISTDEINVLNDKTADAIKATNFFLILFISFLSNYHSLKCKSTFVITYVFGTSPFLSHTIIIFYTARHTENHFGTIIKCLQSIKHKSNQSG